MIRFGPTPVQMLRAMRWMFNRRTFRGIVDGINEAMWRLEAKAAGWR